MRKKVKGHEETFLKIPGPFPWCCRSIKNKNMFKSIVCLFRKRGAVRPCLLSKCQRREQQNQTVDWKAT